MHVDFSYTLNLLKCAGIQILFVDYYIRCVASSKWSGAFSHNSSSSVTPLSISLHNERVLRIIHKLVKNELGWMLAVR